MTLGRWSWDIDIARVENFWSVWRTIDGWNTNYRWWKKCVVDRLDVALNHEVVALSVEIVGSRYSCFLFWLADSRPTTCCQQSSVTAMYIEIITSLTRWVFKADDRDRSLSFVIERFILSADNLSMTVKLN